ncbi:MAG: radical SAM protein [bacterium]|nr:radical SAM protein [bacterium]
MARVALIKCTMPWSINLTTGPPLGIMRLAALLRKEGHDPKIWDLRLAPGEFSRMEAGLREFQPEIVGLSACTPEAVSLHRTAALAKSLASVRTVICGGPHASAYPESILKDPNFKYLVLGEGERTFSELVRAIDSGRDREIAIPGTGWQSGGNIFLGAQRDFIKDLDELPLPAWDLIDLPRYFTARRSATLRPKRYACISTSRGCPYQCSFCHGLMGRKFRSRSLDNIFSEMLWLVDRYGIEEFQIEDDCFNLYQKRVLDYCERVEKEKLRASFVFPNGLRTDILTNEELGAMRKAGTEMIAVAVETVSPRLQKLIGKNLDLERVAETIRECRRLGIATMGFFMFGFPTETREEVQMTIRWAVKSKLDLAIFFLLNPFQGTEIHKKFVRSGGFPPEGEGKERFGYFSTNWDLSTVSERQLARLFRKAYRLFYLRHFPRFFSRPIRRNFLFVRGLRIFFRRAFHRNRS